MKAAVGGPLLEQRDAPLTVHWACHFSQSTSVASSLLRLAVAIILPRHPMIVPPDELAFHVDDQLVKHALTINARVSQLARVELAKLWETNVVTHGRTIARLGCILNCLVANWNAVIRSSLRKSFPLGMSPSLVPWL